MGKYYEPTKDNVIEEMRNAYSTLCDYLEFHPEEEIPDIYGQLIDYINRELQIKNTSQPL